MSSIAQVPRWAREIAQTTVLFWSLIVVCVLVRILLWFIYKPIIYNDTPLYLDLAAYLRHLDFHGYQGERTPGYPLLLLLSGLNYQIVWLVQSVLGISISVMLYLIAKRQTESELLAFIVGLSYTLSINQLFFEAGLLTETLTTFFVVLSLWLLVWLHHTRPENIIYYYLGLGFVIAWGILTRPVMLALVPLYLLWILWEYAGTQTPRSTRLKYLAGFTTPVLVGVLGWSLFNQITLGYFGLTTLSGYTWMEHTGQFIELVPDEYADIKEIYVEFREKQVAQGRSETGTIWRSFSTMMERTGLSYVELSERLNQLSMGMLVQHPALYVRNFVAMWFKFWEPANYWVIEEITNPAITAALQLIWSIEGLGWIVIKYLFWGSSLYYLYLSLKHKENLDFKTRFNLLVIAIVLAVSVLQAVAGGYGDNHRYSIPFDPLILYVIFVSGWSYLRDMKKSNSIAAPQPSSLRRNLRNLLIVLIITFVLLEVVARLLWWDQDAVNNLLGKEVALLPLPLLDAEQAEILDRWAKTPDKYVQFDPALGWSTNPNISTVQEGETYTSNSAGMRSLREYSLEKPEGVIRIGTFGPSFTHGDEVSDEATWQAQMEQAHPELEVLNWGVGGYGTDQAFLRYQMQGAAYQPDIVIIGFEEDNLRRNVNRYRPFFRAGTGLPLTKPVFVAEDNRLRLLENPYTSLDDLRTALVDHPAEFLDKVCPGDYYCIRAYYQPRPLDVFYSFRFYRTLAQEIKQANHPALPAHLDPYVQQVNFLLLEQFVGEILSHGARPVILLFPERTSIEAHEHGQETAYTAGLITLTDHGLPVIDLAPAFVHARQTDQVDYLDYYASEGGHFNARGNYIVSQTVLGYLCQQGLINNC